MNIIYKYVIVSVAMLIGVALILNYDYQKNQQMQSQLFTLIDNNYGNNTYDKVCLFDTLSVKTNCFNKKQIQNTFDLLFNSLDMCQILKYDKISEKLYIKFCDIFKMSDKCQSQIYICNLHNEL